MSRSKDIQKLPTEKQVEEFERLFSLLSHLVSDMNIFSKKKPDGVLNQLKVKMINKVLLQIKEFFSNDPVATFLETLDEETLPTNSDTMLILGQFSSAMSQFKEKFYGQDRSDMTQLLYRWSTDKNPLQENW